MCIKTKNRCVKWVDLNESSWNTGGNINRHLSCRIIMYNLLSAVFVSMRAKRGEREKKKGTNRRCTSPTGACLGAHQVISPSIVTQSRHEPKIVAHGLDQLMLQHLSSTKQLPCVAGFRKGNGDVEKCGRNTWRSQRTNAWETGVHDVAHWHEAGHDGNATNTSTALRNVYTPPSPLRGEWLRTGRSPGVLESL